MPDTYFEFVIGYLFLWVILFLALGIALKKITQQEKWLQNLDSSKKS